MPASPTTSTEPSRGARSRHPQPRSRYLTANSTPDATYATSDVGWASDCTVTRYDGNEYTSTRADGKRQTVSLEGVHATFALDKSYADWIVNEPLGTSPRLAGVSYDLATLTEAQRVTLASVTIGSRIVLSALPAQVPSPLTLIVEGIEETIADDTWTLTFKTSPDTYSHLFILNDATQGVLDAGYLIAP